MAGTVASAAGVAFLHCLPGGPRVSSRLPTTVIYGNLLPGITGRNQYLRLFNKAKCPLVTAFVRYVTRLACDFSLARSRVIAMTDVQFTMTFSADADLESTLITGLYEPHTAS